MALGYYSSPYGSSRELVLRLAAEERAQKRAEKAQMVQAGMSMVGSLANAYIKKRELDQREVSQKPVDDFNKARAADAEIDLANRRRQIDIVDATEQSMLAPGPDGKPNWSKDYSSETEMKAHMNFLRGMQVKNAQDWEALRTSFDAQKFRAGGSSAGQGGVQVDITTLALSESIIPNSAFETNFGARSPSSPEPRFSLADEANGYSEMLVLSQGIEDNKRERQQAKPPVSVYDDVNARLQGPRQPAGTPGGAYVGPSPASDRPAPETSIPADSRRLPPPDSTPSKAPPAPERASSAAIAAPIPGERRMMMLQEADALQRRPFDPRVGVAARRSIKEYGYDPSIYPEGSLARRYAMDNVNAEFARRDRAQPGAFSKFWSGYSQWEKQNYGRGR